MANPNTRMTNRKPTSGVGQPHDDGHKLAHGPAQTHTSRKDAAHAIEAAEHGSDALNEAPAIVPPAADKH